MKLPRVVLPMILSVFAALCPVPAAAAVEVDVRDFPASEGFRIEQETAARQLRVSWRISREETGVLALSLDAARPLIDELGVARGDLPAVPILCAVRPMLALTVGTRDLKAPAGWMAFFDNPPLRAYQTSNLVFNVKRIRVTGGAGRAMIAIDEVSAGAFRGRFEFTIFRDSPLVLAEAVMATVEDGRAILYDAGLVTPSPNTVSLGRTGPNWQSMAWLDQHGKVQRVPVDVNRVAAPQVVARRTIVAEGAHGSVAVFPLPHAYFYPLDFATNLGFTWFGQSGDQWMRGYGFGVQQPPAGDRRWVPWCNAPPNTEQRLGVFYLVSGGNADAALAQVGGYTRDDHYKKIPGHATFASHFHIEHTIELAKKLEAAGPGAKIPDALWTPAFVPVFKARGVDIVHLAEFHVGEMPRLPAARRLPLLKLLFAECARLSDDELLVLPGEEPNVHLGGHWISFFPRPVYWVLNRAPGAPFVEKVPGYGPVYHVGSTDDVLRLMKEEDGLMWTAHPRIKGSREFPDAYFDSEFFRSPQFLGGAWKSMPLDLSQPRLGSRVFDLQDDMANRGQRKYVLGEVDIFRVTPGMETYAHMNVNYLKLDRVPKFGDGWAPVLDALRGGQYFVSTGEVLIPDFSVGGKQSGDTLWRPAAKTVELRAKLEWTFPISFIEIVSGNGSKVERQRVPWDDTASFGEKDVRVPFEVDDRTWVRLEAWDIARNGAFTPPVWIQ